MNLFTESGIIPTALAVYLGATFATFFKSVVADLIIPILGQIFPISETGRITMKINGKVYDIGHVILETIHLVLAIVITLTTLWILHSFSDIIVLPMGAISGGRRRK